MHTGDRSLNKKKYVKVNITFVMFHWISSVISHNEQSKVNLQLRNHHEVELDEWFYFEDHSKTSIQFQLRFLHAKLDNNFLNVLTPEMRQSQLAIHFEPTYCFVIKRLHNERKSILSWSYGVQCLYRF